ncbi:uncharacterized protein LOC5522293 [Nematostella vectensis]|uniref:uncharacterized protein LOC5522293 n=1 Tax=Nematostella vectensis TaxID=45351 RepID=UPI001390491E|nr:uncharacterized protein LOC5522293 [Nematostella vectensis]
MKTVAFALTAVLVIVMLPGASGWWNPLWELNYPVPQDTHLEWAGENGELLMKREAPFETLHDEDGSGLDRFWEINQTDFDFLDSCLNRVSTRLLQYCKPGVTPTATIERLALKELYCRTVALGEDGEFCSNWLLLKRCIATEMNAATRLRYLYINNKLHAQCWAQRTVHETQRVLSDLLVQLNDHHGTMKEVREEGQEEIERGKTLLANSMLEVDKAHDALANMERQWDTIETLAMDQMDSQVNLIRIDRNLAKSVNRDVDAFFNAVVHELGTVEQRRSDYDKIIQKTVKGINLETTATNGKVKGFDHDLGTRRTALIHYAKQLELLLNESLDKYKQTEHAMALAMRLEAYVTAVMGFLTNNQQQFLLCDQQLLQDATLHATCLLFAYLLILYVDAPLGSRILVSVVVPLNFVSWAGVRSSLSYQSLAVLVIVIVVGDICITYGSRLIWEKEAQITRERSMRSSIGYNATPALSHAYHPTYRNLYMPSHGYNPSPIPSRWNHQCCATTQRGYRCKLNRRLNTQFCGVHSARAEHMPVNWSY